MRSSPPTLPLLLLVVASLNCGARSSIEAGAPCVATSETETCDGLDNNCDGQIDEGIAPLRCGQGACQTIVTCEGGAMPACVPRAPAQEICNLVDDDCDGEVDEGFGLGPLGEAIVLREDELDTGDCTSCKWAWAAALAPRDDGFVALWTLGLSGGEEQPNLYRRPIDRFGYPEGNIALDRSDFLLELRPILTLDPRPARGLPLEGTFRVGSGDVPGLVFVDAEGQTDAEIATPGSGPRGVPRTVWTGERFVTAWVEDDALQVAVLGADGSFDHAVEVDPLERPGAITLGVYPGRVGILVSRYRADPERRDQWLLLLDAQGNVTAPARQIDVEYTTWQRLVGTEQGFLHIRPNGFMQPSTRQPLDALGNPLGEALPFADGRHLDDSGLQDTFIPRPGTGEMVTAWQSPDGGDMHIEFLDDDGEVLRGFAGPVASDPGFDQGYVVNPHITFTGDRMLVLWSGISENAKPNRVWVRAFGCVP